MAAGLGYIEFTTGDILTAATANGYLASQTVMVFANAAARTSAIASPQEGMISFLKDTDTLQFYTGSAWSNVDTGASPLTTKGDLYGFSTTNTRLAVGANGTVLTADSAQATGLKWATPSAGAGLTLITSQPFTTSTAINVNNVFSSTYYNYKIMIRLTAGTAGGDSSVIMRLRLSGTDATTNYSGARGFFYSTTVGADSGSSWVVVDQNSSDQVQYGLIELFNPAVAIKTSGWAFTPKINSVGLNIGITSSLQHTTATAYDGFSLTPGSGNITGTVEVYGYAK